jgi:hypothetical protein
VDVILLLPGGHPAIPAIKSLFRKLPRFHVGSPISFTTSSIPHLHSDNLTFITNYLARHNLSVPSNITRFHYQPSTFNDYEHHLYKCIDNSYPLHILRKVLTSHQLIMAAADKTKQLTILESQTFTEELKIHLADKETYEEISSSTYN